ncbi:MAG TPA: RHS repeat-associated core domain-containing protein, partial [Sedimentibacter sp.]|nr:RHS repeat-associated core domain-containing protein [Sedimentibacter sp.]
MNNQTDFNRYNSLILYPVSVGSNIQNWEYEYNAQGLMSKRKDNLLGQEERFVYDNLFRLVSIIKEHGRVDRYNTMTYDEKGNILSKSDVGHYSYDSDKPNAISGLNNEYNTGGFPTFAPPFFNTINTETLNTEYDVNNKIEKISQGNKELKFLYSSTGNRIKTEYKVNNTLQKTVYYIGNYECEVYPNGRIREINYINTSTGHTIVQLKDNKNNIPTDSLYYIFKDHLGSYDRITNQLGQIVETYSFDAWGNRRQASDWTIKDVSETRLFTRGFTGHEHLDAFETINMNGRLYDPTIARFLSPDPYVASNTFTQDFNRYSYCRNNPLLYTDPSGEFIWLPVIAGAIIGTYMGGVIANNDFNPINWNYNSGKTWGYMLGGAIVGGFSGWAGGAIAASGMPMANTAGIMSASFVNSLGTHIYTGGQTPVSISFGIGSYDITNDKWDGIWNWGENSTLENIGYTFGAMA